MGAIADVIDAGQPMRQRGMTTTVSLSDDLWHRYRTHGDMEARASLLEMHLGLVHHCARELAARLPRTVDPDDLVSAGMLGLVQSLEGFDADRGLSFSTYATRRIRGAMLDELRALDWRPRSVREHARHIDAAAARVAAREGRKPSDREIAAEAGMDAEEYEYWRARNASAGTISLEAPVADDRGTTIAETVGDEQASATANLDREDMARRVRQVIATLPEKERVVLSLYYFEELTLRQIAEVLHVTESRVSQIRTQALARLKTRAKAEFEGA